MSHHTAVMCRMCLNLQQGILH